MRVCQKQACTFSYLHSLPKSSIKSTDHDSYLLIVLIRNIARIDVVSGEQLYLTHIILNKFSYDKKLLVPLSHDTVVYKT